ncbi:MAG: class I SAM-dependent methyltransferase [Candidatus Dormibacteraeota bacterium]|nr:class I SAM-dependent methyltransferase [Candidatus Dormibacteraeota bacterium]MBO0759941.1 class I SAM-dependent methyltransferase [Candidatus Dormibacteraeota bacterium]
MGQTDPGRDPIDRAETARVRAVWEREADAYDRMMPRMERLLFAGGREWVCSRAAGDVLEIAIGTGRNLPFYPPDVRLTGIDVSPATLAIARRRSEHLGVRATLLEGDAQDLPFPEGSFDTAVCTLALCTVPDAARVVGEVARVLRPGGRFVLLEHVGSPLAPVRAVEWVIEVLTFWHERDHMTREPLTSLRAHGFQIEELERRKLGVVERVAARRP